MRAPHASAIALTTVLAGTSPAIAQHGRIPIALPGDRSAATPFDLAIAHGDEALDHQDYATAEREFASARQLNPRDPRPEFYLGEVALRQSQWAPAEGHFRAAIRLNPNMAEAHAELGDVLRESNRRADAITELQTATRLDDSLAEAHFTLAMSLEDDGQRDRALTEYRAAVRLAPDSPMPSLNLGILLASSHPARGSQPYSECMRALSSAVRNAQNDRAVFAAAGPAFRLLGETATAVDVLQRAIDDAHPNATLLAELAQALWGQGDHPNALTRIGAALRAEPQRADLHYVRGLMLAGSGDRPGAIAEMRNAARLGAGSPIAQRAQARLTDLQNGGGPSGHR